MFKILATSVGRSKFLSLFKSLRRSSADDRLRVFASSTSTRYLEWETVRLRTRAVDGARSYGCFWSRPLFTQYWTRPVETDSSLHACFTVTRRMPLLYSAQAVLSNRRSPRAGVKTFHHSLKVRSVHTVWAMWAINERLKVSGHLRADARASLESVRRPSPCRAHCASCVSLRNRSVRGLGTRCGS